MVAVVYKPPDNDADLKDARVDYNPGDYEGFVKIDRNIIKNAVFDNEKLLKVWIWCLAKASHRKHKTKVGLQTIELEPGQFVTGRNSAAKELKMNPSTTWKYLKVLEKDQKCDIKSNNKFSVVTLVNWDFYQNIKYERDSNHDNNVTTTSQQRDTNKNDKKGKKGKKKDIDAKKHYAEFVSMTEKEYGELLKYLGDDKTAEMIERLNLYKGSTGRQYASDYLTILNWLRKDKENGKDNGAARKSSTPPGFKVV